MNRGKAIAATVWTAVEQIGASGLGTVFMLVFARFLSPADFGTFVSASLLVGFGGILALLGVRAVVVQRDRVDQTFLSTMFWTCSGVGTLIALALITFRVELSTLFGNPQIARLLPYLCAGMLVSTVTSLLTSLLRRNLDMKRLARRTLAANLISGLIAVPFAYWGLGPIALVIQSVGGTTLTLFFMIRLIGWPFGICYDLATARESAAFGAKVTAADLLTYYDRENPKLFVGMLLGAEALGIFSMALRVMNLLVNTIGLPLAAVTVPILSEVRRTSGQVGEAYLNLVRGASAVVFPLFALVAVFALELVVMLLGDNWAPAAPILRILCLVGIFVISSFINGSTLIALGSPSGRLWFAGLSAAVGTAALLFGAQFGLVGIALALVGRSILIEPFQVAHLLRVAGLSTSAFLMALRVPLIASLGILPVGHISIYLLPGASATVLMLIVTPIVLLIYILAIITFIPEIKREIFYMLKSFKGR